MAFGKGENPCQICGVTDENKAMCFRGENWCCDQHRKMLLGEIPREFAEKA